MYIVAFLALQKTGKQGNRGHGCDFFAPWALKNACWGLPPQTRHFGTKCPEVRRIAPVVASQSLTLLFLVFPPTRQAEQMIDITFHRHDLPHFLLSGAVLRI